MYREVKIVLVVVLMLLQPAAYTQNEINSPYSGFGAGRVNKSSSGILDAMGGTSYAMQDPYYINFRNPASYAAFDSLSLTVDVGASIYFTSLTTESASQKNSYARPGYICIGLPVTQHWRTSIGTFPFSTVGYNITDTKSIDKIGDIEYKYQGSGGINRLYWGNAFKIYKGLSAGLNISYMFGTLFSTRISEFDGNNFYNTRISDAYHLDGIYLTGGLQYFFNVRDKHRIGIGAVYGNTVHIWAKEKLLVNYYEHAYNPANTYDTVFYDDRARGSLTIPQSVGAGLSYCYKDKLTVATDVTWQNWDKYKFMAHDDSLKNSITVTLGVQYIPDPMSGKFLKRLNFRAGAKYSPGELVLRNTRISEMGFCMGIGLPLQSFNTHSSINILFEFGKMGSLTKDLQRENYFRISFNFTLQEKWYQKLKIE